METCNTCKEKPVTIVESSDTFGVFIRFDCACNQIRIELYKIAPIIYRVKATCEKCQRM